MMGDPVANPHDRDAGAVGEGRSLGQGVEIGAQPAGLAAGEIEPLGERGAQGQHQDGAARRRVDAEGNMARPAVAAWSQRHFPAAEIDPDGPVGAGGF